MSCSESSDHELELAPVGCDSSDRHHQGAADHGSDPAVISDIDVFYCTDNLDDEFDSGSNILSGVG